jgi:hypothetical protein
MDFQSGWKIPVTIGKFKSTLSTIPLTQEADEKEDPAEREVA